MKHGDHYMKFILLTAGWQQSTTFVASFSPHCFIKVDMQMALYISGLLLCQNRVPKTKGKQRHENKPLKQTHT